MEHQSEPRGQHEADDAASPVPNRRERRGHKSEASPQHGGKSAVGRRHAPVKQFNRRRGGG